MSEIKINVEIGENLKEAMFQLIYEAGKRQQLVGTELQKAFGVNLSTVSAILGGNKLALDAGCSVDVKIQQSG